MPIFDEATYDQPSWPATWLGSRYVRPDKYGVVNNQPGLQYPGDPYLMQMDQKNKLLKALLQGGQISRLPQQQQFTGVK